jgi:hypothetical protein
MSHGRGKWEKGRSGVSSFGRSFELSPPNWQQRAVFLFIFSCLLLAGGSKVQRGSNEEECVAMTGAAKREGEEGQAVWNIGGAVSSIVVCPQGRMLVRWEKWRAVVWQKERRVR